MSYFDNNNGYSNQIAAKQAKMFAYSKIHEANRNNKILEQSTTWINTSPRDLKDERTGRRVKAKDDLRRHRRRGIS